MNPLDTMTTPFEEETDQTQAWFDSPRFEGITRLYSARQVVVQRGTINQDHTVAREAAEQFYARVRQGLGHRGPRAGPGQLPAQPGAERGGDTRACAADRRP